MARTIEQPLILPPPAPKKVTGLSLFLLILISTLFSLLMIELITGLKPDLIPIKVRAFLQMGLEETPQGIIPHESLGYVYAPNLENHTVPFSDQRRHSVSTVSLGYENVGFRDDGLNGPPFAVAIGDSVAACFGVEMNACWVEILEQATGRDIANLGVPGYGPQQEQRMLAEYGLPLQPKLVLWVFFANDLIGAWHFQQFGALGTRDEGEFWRYPAHRWLADHSNIYITSTYFWYNRYFYDSITFSDDPLVKQDKALAWWLASSDTTIPEVAQGWQLTQTAIETAYQQTRATGAEFVVIIIPPRSQVLYADEPFAPVLDEPQNKIVEFLEGQEIPYLDLTAPLKALDPDQAKSLYFPGDMHLNAQGNEVVAGLVGQKLDLLLTTNP